MKRTLTRELEVPEIAENEENGTSTALRDCRVKKCTSNTHCFSPRASKPACGRGNRGGHGAEPAGLQMSCAGLARELQLWLSSRSILVAHRCSSWHWDDGLVPFIPS